MEYKKLNLFYCLTLMLYHRWRAFLRCQKHRLFNRLYTNPKHWWIPLQAGPVEVPTLYGFKVIVNPSSDEIIGRSVYYNGTYEAGTMQVLSKCLSSGNAYFDIGSNIGLMALFASKCVGPNGNVFAFEPEPETFKILEENIKLNHYTNIEPLQIALGSSQSTATIYNSETNRGAASLIPSDELIGKESVINIETLDGLMAKRENPIIRMMKIDVEGWELEVLKGGKHVLSQENAPILCIECSELRPMQGGINEDMFTFISEINQYQIYRLARGKDRVSKLVRIEIVDQLPKHDNIFCFLPCHLKQLNPSMFK